MIEGVSHITFIVKDLEASAKFFTYIFKAVEVYSSGEDTFSISREKFFLIGEQWIAIMEGNSDLSRTYNHIAFKVADCDLESYESRIRELGLEFKTPRPRVEGEGRSLYFYDYDNHLFELHSGTLAARLARYQIKAK